MELENSTENGPGGVRVGQISKVPLPQPGFQFYCVLRRGGRSRTSESNTARETATCRSSTQSSWSWPMSVSVGARRRSAYHTRTAVAERERKWCCVSHAELWQGKARSAWNWQLRSVGQRWVTPATALVAGRRGRVHARLLSLFLRSDGMVGGPGERSE
jgi:hypothetical protein